MSCTCLAGLEHLLRLCEAQRLASVVLSLARVIEEQRLGTVSHPRLSGGQDVGPHTLLLPHLLLDHLLGLADLLARPLDGDTPLRAAGGDAPPGFEAIVVLIPVEQVEAAAHHTYCSGSNDAKNNRLCSGEAWF